jgi:hypothetical protein
LGITRDQKEKLYKHLNEFTKVKNTDAHRNKGQFSDKEKKYLEGIDWDFAKSIRPAVLDFYKETEKYYDDPEPEQHLWEIQKAIILVLYVCCPNVRNAWYPLMFDGNSQDNNLIIFGQERVTYVLNRHKIADKTEFPIVGDFPEEVAHILRKFYLKFRKGKLDSLGYMFTNFNGRPWDGKSFTSMVTNSIQKLFNGSLNARMMRVLEIMSSAKLDASPEEKKLFSILRGHSPNVSQTDMYNRTKEKGKRPRLHVIRCCQCGKNGEEDEVDENCSECDGHFVEEYD